MTLTTLERFQGCLLGLAAGDVVGTRVEFRSRDSFTPIAGMLGGGPFSLEPGQWTDDTSMALCLAASLLECGAFDAADQMQKYCNWYDHGYMSSTGTCFDIGVTVRQALSRYKATGNPFSGVTDPMSAGNGCLMRLAPVPMFYVSDRERALHFAAESSRTTHGALECLEASQLFGHMLLQALSGSSKTEISLEDAPAMTSASLRAIAEGAYHHKSRDEIRGSGYVVESLEGALWCFWSTETFEEAVLLATNLGDDADTTAAICGQVAGAYYGLSGIPEHWLEMLAMREEINKMATQLYKVSHVQHLETAKRRTST